MSTPGAALTEDYLNLKRMPIFSHERYLYVMSFSMGIICQTVTILGIIGNVINCIVFFKQGFSDCINISLLALAVSDLCSLLTIMWSNLCFTPAFQDSGIPMVTYEIHLITGSWPHLMFTRVTGWITAFISLERCVCVILPLKVKTLFSSRTHIISTITFFTVSLACGSVAYSAVGINWVYVPETNRTILGNVFLLADDSRHVINAICFILNGVLLPVSCFISVVFFTALLIIKLYEKANWRQQHSNAAKSMEKTNSKEIKVAKMVLFISITFITSFIPAVGFYIAAFVEPELSYDGLYGRCAMVILSISFITETTNSSINILVYLKMSTKFRHTFLCMFGFKSV